MESHLLQMRGLKRPGSYTRHTDAPSHLLQMRGLKQNYKNIAKYYQGRIFYRCVD